MHQRMCAQCHLSLTDQTDLQKLSLSGINLVDWTYVGLRESVEFGNMFQKNINIRPGCVPLAPLLMNPLSNLAKLHMHNTSIL